VLTADHSTFEDWRKVTLPWTMGKEGQEVEVHFYRNVKTGATNFEADYKVKLIAEAKKNN